MPVSEDDGMQRKSVSEVTDHRGDTETHDVVPLFTPTIQKWEKCSQFKETAQFVQPDRTDGLQLFRPVRTRLVRFHHQ